MTLVLDALAVAGRLAPTSLTFSSGTLTAVIGENGAGKSTLLDAIVAVVSVTGGRVRFRDVDLTALGPQARAQRIASIGAREPDVDDMTVGERVGLGLVARRGVQGLDAQARARVAEVARALDLEALLARPTGTLSSGERRRATVARALVDADAPVVLLDEPLTGVDVARQGQVIAALRARARAGSVVVFSVHELQHALAADRIVGMKGGAVVFDGPPAALAGEALERVFGVRQLEVVRVG